MYNFRNVMWRTDFEAPKPNGLYYVKNDINDINLFFWLDGKWYNPEFDANEEHLTERGYGEEITYFDDFEGYVPYDQQVEESAPVYLPPQTFEKVITAEPVLTLLAMAMRFCTPEQLAALTSKLLSRTKGADRKPSLNFVDIDARLLNESVGMSNERKAELNHKLSNLEHLKFKDGVVSGDLPRIIEELTEITNTWEEYTICLIAVASKLKDHHLIP